MRRQSGTFLTEFMIVAAIIAILAAIGIDAYEDRTATNSIISVTATVTSKDATCKQIRWGTSCEYMVFTSEGILQNLDSTSHNKENSPSIQKFLKEGSMYQFDITQPKSGYPNIINVREVYQ